jgi:hypothetical protein
VAEEKRQGVDEQPVIVDDHHTNWALVEISRQAGPESRCRFPAALFVQTRNLARKPNG